MNYCDLIDQVLVKLVSSLQSSVVCVNVSNNRRVRKYDNQRSDHGEDNADIDRDNGLDLSRLTNLGYLDAGRCDLTVFPTNISPTVKYLILNNNNFNKVPDLRHLVNLRELNLKSCGLTELNTAWLPPSITDLNISFNKDLKITGDFSHLTNLRCLHDYNK